MSDKSITSNSAEWHPVSGLTHTYESLALSSYIGNIVREIQKSVPEDILEQRANNPEYKLLPNEWIAHTAKIKVSKFRVLKTVARLPKSLLILSPEEKKDDSTRIKMTGFLWKKGNSWNHAFKRRYIELIGSKMIYYKHKPEDKYGKRLPEKDAKDLMKGYIDLEKVHSIQPKKTENRQYTIELVTPNRTWCAAADDMDSYKEWLEVICQIVPFHAVDSVYRRMFQLQEVSAAARTDVRMNISLTDTVGDLIPHIFKCYQQTLDAAPLHPFDPKKFFLKVTGFRDYLLDYNCQISEYRHVRECELTGKTLRLTLVHENEILANYSRSLSFHIDSKATLEALEHSCVPEDRRHKNETTYANVNDAELLLEDQNMSRNNLRYMASGQVDNPLQIRMREVVQLAELFEKHKDILNFGSNSVDSIVSSGSLGVFLRLELYNGGKAILNSRIETNVVPVQKKTYHQSTDFNVFVADWKETSWRHTNLMISEMPRSLRLVVTLYAVKTAPTHSSNNSSNKFNIDNSSNGNSNLHNTAIAASAAGVADLNRLSAGGSRFHAIGSTGLNIFDADGVLVNGDFNVNLMSEVDSKEFGVGPVPHIFNPTQPSIHIQFGEFPNPPKFDWSCSSKEVMETSCAMDSNIITATATTATTVSTNSELHAPSTVVLNPIYEEVQNPLLHDDDGSGDEVIEKKGFLNKLGKYHFASKMLQRWFHLSERTLDLKYYENENSAKPKGVILLSGATLTYADDFNRTYTKFVINKGTRKKMSTYVFKLKPAASSREYIIEASSKEERDEWMSAIQNVASVVPATENANRATTSTSTLTSSNLDLREQIMSSDNGSFSAAATTTTNSAYEDNNASVTSSTTMGARLFRGGSSLSSSSSSSVGGGSFIDGNISSSFHQQSRLSTSVSSCGSEEDEKINQDLCRILDEEPLYKLNSKQQKCLIKNRRDFYDRPQALSVFLSSVNWLNKAHVREALVSMKEWSAPEHLASYIGLLDGKFANEQVREFAVQKLREMSCTTLSYFLPQLVQALKYENHHVSSLAGLLIERGIENPNQFGFDLFWAMRAESYELRFRERYGVLLNAYLDVCCPKQRAILQLQDKLFSADGIFARICEQVKSHKDEGMPVMISTLKAELALLNEILPDSFQLPIDSRVEVSKIIIDKCSVMGSAKKPLWLVFENAEPGGEPIQIIFKAGDDVRQDCLTLQIIRLMDEMWREEGLDLAMEPYKCVATSPDHGILEVVKNSVTTAKVHERSGGVMGAYKKESFLDWIKENNPGKQFKHAVDLFKRSCAGYCVATCVLGIGDRHNDNIMISSSGRYFHIDFGHFMGFFKYQFGIKRETTSFVFTKEMAHVFGGKDSKEYMQFVDLCCTSYNIIRRHLHLLVSLLNIMIAAKMPELQSVEELDYIVTILKPKLHEENAHHFFATEINNCLESNMRSFDNFMHLVKHT